MRYNSPFRRHFAFLKADDDCIVDRSWLRNVFKIIKSTNADIVTGPQIPLKKKYLDIPIQKAIN